MSIVYKKFKKCDFRTKKIAPLPKQGGWRSSKGLVLLVFAAVDDAYILIYLSRGLYAVGFDFLNISYPYSI